ncbi:hypothetical protein BYT27DRAFT_7262659 [Phlegmacium glaucopus]|nr:hypothetical protein BYT27DRAFT_7262659 [Phlegmacium glaucopus]
MVFKAASGQSAEHGSQTRADGKLDMCLLWRKHGSRRTGTWAFISVQILRNEVLLYLKHHKRPLLLSKRMQLLVSNNTFLEPGLVVGDHEKSKPSFNLDDPGQIGSLSVSK